ncbi:MAG: YihA family ribosome biogenesis GTP-binding protein [Calditrichaeota bacterium]|nr:YihA family ribosome biogenesis GTP-binding protein [Calditrichota bacterium]
MKIKQPRFVKSILNPAEKPFPELPEIAFVGRSNVGKSSLINTLVNIRNFARVSKKPGKTRTINFFNIDNRCYFVDLPGYGYAKAPKTEQKKWQRAIEPYLLENPKLRLLFVLVDAKVGAKDSDRQLIEWLQYHRIPFQIVATKADQISQGKWQKQRQLICEQLHLPADYPLIFFSAKNRTGRQDILGLIEKLLSE